MKTKNLVLMALLVGVGCALYLVIPGIMGGMKPDFMLTMMFVGILLFPNNPKESTWKLVGSDIYDSGFIKVNYVID